MRKGCDGENILFRGVICCSGGLYAVQVGYMDTLYFDQSEASKYKMAARGPQNGRRGLERGPTLGYWALLSTFAK